MFDVRNGKTFEKLNDAGKVLVEIKAKKPTIIILLVALAIIFTLGINGYTENKLANKEDRIIELQLEQAKHEFRLDLKSFPEDKRLREINDLNTFFEPTEQTFKLLKRWEIVHQVDPNYPYPKNEIEEQDWMGMHYFLYGDLDDEEGAAKADMIYDKNNTIDRDVYDYIGTGDASSDHPIVQEVEKRIESNE